MNNVKKYVLLLGWLVASIVVTAQADTENQIRVIGRVYDAVTPELTFNLMVVNKTTGRGNFAGASGEFNIVANKEDTILLSTQGYKLAYLCFTDSVYRPVYNVEVKLEHLIYDIKPVEIFAPRDLNEIAEDIQKLGYEEKDYRLSGIDAASSPITFLYQSLSRKEQKVREAYELINDQKRRDLLKEIFAKYAEHDIIQLEYHEFDKFIDFCQISDQQLKSMSQYEFIMYIKERYRIYQIVLGEDYYLDRD